MTTSPVSPLSLAIFLFILLPTFSSSSCPSVLQCNSTEPIEIRPPFFVATPGLDPAVVVQDVQLSVSNNLPCSFFFTFRPPVDNFERSYHDLVTWFSSISCSHSDVTVFRSIFGHGKEVHQSIEPDERGLASCHASPRFEWIRSFSEVGSAGQIPLVNFSVQSGSIRKYLLSLSDCVSDGDHSKNGTSLLMAGMNFTRSSRRSKYLTQILG